MSDSGLRRLERLAAQGDPVAMAALPHMRNRMGLCAQCAVEPATTGFTLLSPSHAPVHVVICAPCAKTEDCRARRQPDWKLVGSLGDVNPLDYGGSLVYVDKTGVYPPEMEVIEPAPDDDEDGPITISRLTLEPHTYVNGVLSDNQFHPAYAVWYAREIASIADSMSMDEEELIAMFCSDDPMERADAYMAVIGHSGVHEFDSYPLIMSREEAGARYAGDI